MTYFVDTNIFIYLLFPNVDGIKHKRVKLLFERAGNDDTNLWTTEWVIAELAWFLARKKYTWGEVKSALLDKIFKTKGLKIRRLEWLTQVVERTEKVTDFVDIVNVKIIEELKIQSGYSYDKGLDKWKSFKRLQP